MSRVVGRAVRGAVADGVERSLGRWRRLHILRAGGVDGRRRGVRRWLHRDGDLLRRRLGDGDAGSALGLRKSKTREGQNVHERLHFAAR